MRFVHLLLLAALIPGAQTAAQPISTTDSAGVRILTYAGLDSSSAAFSIGGEPIFRVGLDPAGRLFERLVAITVLGDGRIAVGDGGGSQEVVFLDPDGSVDQVLGGVGEGPGEFSMLEALTPIGHSGLIAQDYRRARVTVFDDGEVFATFRMPPLEHPTVLGASGDSLFMGPPLQVVMGKLYPTPWRRVPLTIKRISTLEEDTLLTVEWDQSLNFRGRAPWKGTGFAAFSGNEFIYGRGDLPQVSWYDTRGKLIHLTRWMSAPEEVSESDWAAYEEWRLFGRGPAGSTPTARSLLVTAREQSRGVKPYFDDLKVDPEGHVWLGEWYNFSYGSQEQGRRYFILGPDGVALGSTVMPSGFRLLAVDRSRVIGYELGAFDEQIVVAYPLVQAAVGHPPR